MDYNINNNMEKVTQNGMETVTGKVKKKRYINVVGVFGCLLGLISLWLPFYGDGVNISLYEASNLDGDGKIFFLFLVPIAIALVLFLLRLNILPMLVGTAGNAIIGLLVYMLNDRNLGGSFLIGYYFFLAGAVVVVLSLFLNKPLIRLLKKGE